MKLIGLLLMSVILSSVSYPVNAETVKMELETSKEIFEVYEEIKIQGNIAIKRADISVTLYVFDPSNRVIIALPVYTNEVGNFSFSFILDEEKLVGTYRVLAVAGVIIIDSSERIMAETSFKFIKPFLSVSRLFNSAGTPVEKTEISVENEILVRSIITNNPPKATSFAYILQVKDSDGITQTLSLITKRISPRESMGIALAWVPEIPGEYTIETFVWDDIDKQPTPLYSSRTFTITVK